MNHHSHRSPIRLALLSIVGAAGALLLAGCGNAVKGLAEQAVEKACNDAAKENGETADCDVSMEDGQVKVSTKDGDVTLGGTELPSDWPDYLTPDGAKVVSVASAGDGQVVGFSTGDVTPGDLGDQAKAGGCTAPEGADVMGANIVTLECEGSDVLIMGSNEMITVTRSTNSN